MYKSLHLLLFLVCQAGLQAQTLSSISSRWSDSFVEWDVFATMPLDSSELTDSTDWANLPEPEEEEFGDLKLRWLNVKDDFSEWDFSLGHDLRGTIKQKWKNDKTQWELRTYTGDVITMRAAWANDLTEWRITDNTTTLIFRSRWTSQLDEWLVKDSSRGKFYLYTLRSRDPRDWAIEDSLGDSVSLSMKMAMVFIAVFHGSPRL